MHVISMASPREPSTIYKEMQQETGSLIPSALFTLQRISFISEWLAVLSQFWLILFVS